MAGLDPNAVSIAATEAGHAASSTLVAAASSLSSSKKHRMSVTR